MPDQVHVERVHVRLWNAVLERSLRRDSIGALRHEAEPDRDAMHVCVDRKVRTIEGEEEHARRGLRTDTGQREERVPELLIGHIRERALVERNAALADPTEHRPDAHGLRRSETAATNRAGDRGQRRVGNLVPSAKPSSEIRIRAIAVRVAGVLRQNREDELLERRKVSSWWRYAIGARETTRDRAKTAPVHSSERIGNGGSAGDVGIK